VGVPLCAGINHYTTGTLGRSARNLLRGRSRATRLASTHEQDPLVAQVLLHVSRADDRLRSAEAVLLDALGVATPAIVPEEELFARLRAAPEETRRGVYDAAVQGAALGGRLHRREQELLQRLADACGVRFDPKQITAAVCG
jgi:hypothetical protein